MLVQLVYGCLNVCRIEQGSASGGREEGETGDEATAGREHRSAGVDKDPRRLTRRLCQGAQRGFSCSFARIIFIFKLMIAIHI